MCVMPSTECGQLTVATPPKKNDSPASSHHHLPTVPQIKVRLSEPLPYPCYSFEELPLVQVPWVHECSRHIKTWRQIWCTPPHHLVLTFFYLHSPSTVILGPSRGLVYLEFSLRAGYATHFAALWPVMHLCIHHCPSQKRSFSDEGWEQLRHMSKDINIWKAAWQHNYLPN